MLKYRFIAVLGMSAFILSLPCPLLATDEDQPTAAGAATAPSPPLSDSGAYVLGIGDKVRIIVFGEDDLSGEFEISSTGSISMPLIGDVQASGTTVKQLKSTVAAKLADGYMKNPKVSLEVLNYRPFFIVGEVIKPGSYNYVNGMTVINAVALAGGYTYRADKDDIHIKHRNDSHKGDSNDKGELAKESTVVQPGDVIEIKERFF